MTAKLISSSGVVAALVSSVSDDKLSPGCTPSGVDFHVPVEVSRLREAQHTQLALVRLLPAVYPHVLRQR